MAGECTALTINHLSPFRTGSASKYYGPGNGKTKANKAIGQTWPRLVGASMDANESMLAVPTECSSR